MCLIWDFLNARSFLTGPSRRLQEWSMAEEEWLKNPQWKAKKMRFYSPISSGSVPVAHRRIRLCSRTEQHGQRELLPAITVSISQDVEAQAWSAYINKPGELCWNHCVICALLTSAASTRLSDTRDTRGTRCGPSPAPPRAEAARSRGHRPCPLPPRPLFPPPSRPLRRRRCRPRPSPPSRLLPRQTCPRRAQTSWLFAYFRSAQRPRGLNPRRRRPSSPAAASPLCPPPLFTGIQLAPWRSASSYQ